MKIRVQSIHFTADQKLLDFIQKKVDKLETFFDQIVDAEVFLKLDKAENSENKIAEIKINVPGNVIFAKEQCSSFEAATDKVVEQLEKQIKKHKDKIKDHDPSKIIQ